MAKYSIIVCNKNMEQTIRQSVLSMLSHINDDYEVVVVDGGSTDDSISILNDVSKKHDNLRIIELGSDNERTLGEDRNIGVREADGKYVLTQLDADDVYNKGIQDFVRIFHAVDEVADFDFYLKGDGINMAKREFLMEYPYRDFNRSEDLDLWMRLFSDNAIIWLDHERFWETIGYDESAVGIVKNNLYSKIGSLRAGVSLRSCFADVWSRRRVTDPRLYFDLITFVIGYILALKSGRYDAPEGFTEYGSLRKTIEKESTKLPALADKYDIDIDKLHLSETGRELFIDY